MSAENYISIAVVAAGCLYVLGAAIYHAIFPEHAELGLIEDDQLERNDQ